MEQGRVLIAVILSFVVFLVWDFLFVDRSQVAPPPIAEQRIEGQAPPPVEVKEKESDNQPVNPAPVMTEAITEDRPSRTITVKTPLYTATFDEAKGGISGYVLKKYREKTDPDAPFKSLIPQDLKITQVPLGLKNEDGSPVQTSGFRAESGEDLLDVTTGEKTLLFVQIGPDGVMVEKRFTFHPDHYLMGMDFTVKQTGPGTLTAAAALAITQPVEGENSYGFVGPSVHLDNRLEQIKVKKISENPTYDGTIGWMGIQDRYFLSALIPKNQEKSRVRLTLADLDLVTATYETPAFTLGEGASKTFSFDIFMGPMSMSVLGRFDNGLAKAINFGMFDFLAKPCLWLMNFIYDNIIHNYGVAIIILTLLIKAILWPLGNKSYKSMADMKRLQPEMQRLREKYKDDKRKMNEELMQLYRTYKVNPMGGCLPMLVQIPVFFALYRMLYQAIELRHAPFFGWINDLSAPDRLLEFGFSIPMMQPPYGIPVLTLIMGGTMFLQQKMSPPMGDPTQAKMMMLMPIFFTVIFINFSSGLVLYWLVNNVVSIAQQYYIQKKNA